MIIQAFEDTGCDLETNPEWKAFLVRLVENIEIHGSQSWYWAAWGVELEDAWKVAPYMRKMSETHFRLKNSHNSRSQNPRSAASPA